jgi:hypothetical protein
MSIDNFFLMHQRQKMVDSTWGRIMFLLVVSKISFDLLRYAKNLELHIRSYAKNLQ